MTPTSEILQYLNKMIESITAMLGSKEKKQVFLDLVTFLLCVGLYSFLRVAVSLPICLAVSLQDFASCVAKSLPHQNDSKRLLNEYWWLAVQSQQYLYLFTSVLGTCELLNLDICLIGCSRN